MDGIPVSTGWVQPLAERTEARKDLILTVTLTVTWRVEAELRTEPRASPPALGSLLRRRPPAAAADSVGDRLRAGRECS